MTSSIEIAASENVEMHKVDLTVTPNVDLGELPEVTEKDTEPKQSQLILERVSTFETLATKEDLEKLQIENPSLITFEINTGLEKDLSIQNITDANNTSYLSQTEEKTYILTQKFEKHVSGTIVYLKTFIDDKALVTVNHETYFEVPSNILVEQKQYENQTIESCLQHMQTVTNTNQLIEGTPIEPQITKEQIDDITIDNSSDTIKIDLECRSNPKPVYNWYQNGNVLTKEKKRVRFADNGETFSLQIENPEHTDAGFYTFVAKGQEKMAVSKFYIKLNKDYLYKEDIEQKQDSQTIEENIRQIQHEQEVKQKEESDVELEQVIMPSFVQRPKMSTVELKDGDKLILEAKFIASQVPRVILTYIFMLGN